MHREILDANEFAATLRRARRVGDADGARAATRTAATGGWLSKKYVCNGRASSMAVARLAGAGARRIDLRTSPESGLALERAPSW